jgi:hypothetical protein
MCTIHRVALHIVISTVAFLTNDYINLDWSFSLTDRLLNICLSLQYRSLPNQQNGSNFQIINPFVSELLLVISESMSKLFDTNLILFLFTNLCTFTLKWINQSAFTSNGF